MDVGDASGDLGGEAGGAGGAVRDDRVLKTTRVVSAAVVPVLAAAFVILFFFPAQSCMLWGWTIPTNMSAMFMGGGYLSGAVFFTRAWKSPEWHRLGPGIVATTVFATMLGIATFLHWGSFNHDHVSFLAWLLLYTTTPLLLPWLFVTNRRHDPRTPAPGERLVPGPLRAVLATMGAAQLAFALTLFVRPSLFTERWPWTLDTVSARSLAGFAAFPAVTYLAFAFERRWSALRWPFETAMIGLALVGVAGVVQAGEFTAGAATVWAWRIGLLATLAFLGWVRWTMGSARPVEAAQEPDAGPVPAAAG